MTHVTSAHDTNGNGLPRVPSIPLSDETTVNGDQSIGHLVKDATTHLSTLLRGEIELAKAEIAKEAKKAVFGSLFFIAALVIVLYSTFFFFFYVADQLTVWLPRPLASGIVVAGMWLIAGVFVFLGIRKVRKLKAPERTIGSLKDTAAALTHRGTNGDKPGTELSTEVAGTSASLR